MLSDSSKKYPWSMPPPQLSPVVFVPFSTYGFGGRGGGLRPDPPLGGRWGGAFFSGVPQLLGGFGGAGSTSSVSVPRMGMGGGEPSLSAGNTLSGTSFMLTEMGRSPVDIEVAHQLCSATSWRTKCIPTYHIAGNFRGRKLL